MSLAAEFVAHLRRPGPNAAALADALASAGLTTEAGCLRAWSHGHKQAEGTWVEARPPRAPAVGARWFDPCELALHLCTGRGWLAQRPVSRWQLLGFLDVAERVPQEVQVVPRTPAFDPARMAPDGDERARATALTHGEAQLYAWWWGKSLPHWVDWQLLAEDHPALYPRFALTHEWCVDGAVDEAERVTISPATVGRSPEEAPEMLRGELAWEVGLGLRTATDLSHGPFSTVTSWFLNPEPWKLRSLLDRARFDSR